jgi:large conductance mechanosensitive channel
MLKEFKQFLLRGNVVDLAVGVVVGAAFTTVVNAIVADILTPLISAIIKVPDFSTWSFNFRGSEFKYGHFLNALIAFLLAATAVFFFIIKPMNLLKNFRKRDKQVEKILSTKKCSECLSDIPLAAKRCAHCTQPQPVTET